MSRSSYRKIDGEWQWIEFDKETPETVAPFVHGDTMSPLRHPVTGEMADSKTRWNEINKEHGLKVVGNDLLSKFKNKPPEKITEALILDKIHKAEAIVKDPTKRRAWENENIQIYEQRKHLLNGR